MSERRVLFNFGLIHQTSGEQITELTEALRQIIDAISVTRFDRAHFVRIGESSLEFEVVYYLQSSDYNVYMDTQQRIHLELMRACGQRDIVFAHPPRTLHVAAQVPLAILHTDRYPATGEEAKMAAS